MDSQLSIPYDDVDQAKMRLLNTIIVINGSAAEVVNVQRIDKKIVLQYVLLPARHAVDQISLMDEGVNLRKIPLGYVNIWGEALYLRRQPARQQRQGLCNANVVVSNRQRNRQKPRLFDLAYSGEFCDMVRGIYPSVNEAIKLFEDDPHRISVAIHRHFAIHIDRDLNFYTLHYKGERVAWGDPAAWNLPSHLSYMEGLLRENNINFRM